MKRMLYTVVVFLFLSIECAAAPVLCFSDITSGPKTGLGDGLGSGAIVTVWGWHLGSSQGTSIVQVGDVEAAYVYEWVNATQHSGHPSDLFTHHKMQTISFSVPSAAVDGANTISVTVDDETSNTLPFTVRSGEIYHIGDTGNDTPSDSNPGSWTSPWATLQYFTLSAANGTAAAGSIVYAQDITTNNPLPIGTTGVITGTASHPRALIAYPGATVVANSSETYNWGSHNSDDTYWHLSKVKLTGIQSLVSTTTGGRVVGCELTDHPSLPPSPSQVGIYIAGNSTGSGGGSSGYGNYIHDNFQGDDYSQMHTTYFSNRSGSEIQPFDFAWNYLKNSDANHGIHSYDEGAGGGYTGTCHIHHNVVEDQSGISIGVNNGAATGYGVCDNTFAIYSNLIIQSGRGPQRSNSTWYEVAVAFGTNDTLRYGAEYTIDFYNNTIYGWGETGASAPALITGAVLLNPNFNSVNFKNNLFYDLYDIDFTENSTPVTTHTNNLWYNGGDALPSSAPSWDTDPLTNDPLFTNAGENDFSLQPDSPAANGGTSPLPGYPFSRYGIYGSSLVDEIGAAGTGEIISDVSAPVVSNVSPASQLSCESDPQSITLSSATDEPATCRYGDDGASWDAMSEMDTTGGVTHSHSISLSCDQEYQYDIVCRDSSGNEAIAASADFEILTEQQSNASGSSSGGGCYLSTIWHHVK